MNWTNRIFRVCRLRHLLALVLLALLSACATSPAPDNGASSTQAEAAAKTRLQGDFADAVTLKKNGQVEAAESRFQALSVAHPDLAGPLANLGIIARERGDSAQAEAYFNRVIARHPDHRQALNALGVMARERGDFGAAERYYRRALDADPDYQPALKNLAILLELYQGKLEEAMALVEHYQSLQDEPDRKLEDWVFDLKNRIN